MSKRKPASPYKNPPRTIVRALMKTGWRRCDAEGIGTVWERVLAVRHADHVPPSVAADLAVLLDHNPVLAGAMLWVPPWPGTADALRQILLTSPEDRQGPLRLLLTQAVIYENALQARGRIEEDLPA